MSEDVPVNGLNPQDHEPGGDPPGAGRPRVDAGPSRGEVGPLNDAGDFGASRDDALVEALASGRTYGEAGRAINVTARTVQRRMAVPAFSRRVAERRREMTSEITGRLTDACAQAVTVLASGLGEDRPADRLRAAQLILSLTTRFRTVEELETRVVELEAQVESLVDRTPGS